MVVVPPPIIVVAAGKVSPFLDVNNGKTDGRAHLAPMTVKYVAANAADIPRRSHRSLGDGLFGSSSISSTIVVAVPPRTVLLLLLLPLLLLSPLVLLLPPRRKRDEDTNGTFRRIITWA